MKKKSSIGLSKIRKKNGHRPPISLFRQKPVISQSINERMGRKQNQKKQKDKKNRRHDPLHRDGLVESVYELRSHATDYAIFGKSFIEKEALAQMDRAMRLPVSICGALMPDAHSGYGLPIGGVLATQENIVIPYAVGVDIACRMCLSVYDLPASLMTEYPGRFKKLIGDHTVFGVGGTNKNHIDTTVFDRPEWKSTEIIRSLQNKAYSQLGTSGAGNHFVEWGKLEVLINDDLLNVEPGIYLALLSHSGSRGFGNDIAGYYSRLAMRTTVLPKEARQLAWLDLKTAEGEEYWIAMNLAGEYASANHHEIHRKIARALEKEPIRIIENHHNFAWKDRLPDGRAVIIHRKGATPAGRENIGIIPGSMTHPGFVVRGTGNQASLNSASHGAGRSMSRTAALGTFCRSELDLALKEAGVVLVGGGLDEAPMAYKDIQQVMALQQELVMVLAKFSPGIVQMA
jgi:tRNA-splicing ligase RtcB (3'-phosphate/5'-hydroxy nucleic acid ligase)